MSIFRTMGGGCITIKMIFKTWFCLLILFMIKLCGIILHMVFCLIRMHTFQETLLASKSLGLIASDDNHRKRGFIMISCRGDICMHLDLTNATMISIEVAHSCGWWNFWLQSNFMLVIQVFTNFYMGLVNKCSCGTL